MSRPCGPMWWRGSGDARLLRRHRRGVDELRQPLVAALHVRSIHRLELGRRERVRRGTRHHGVGPRLEAREFLDVAELADPVQEDIALQEGRVAGVHHRIGVAVEEGSAALFFFFFKQKTAYEM